MTVIETKVRRIGTSLGVILPREALKERNLEEGETITLILPPKKNLKMIEKAFGSARGSKPFVRDKTDRLERLYGKSS